MEFACDDATEESKKSEKEVNEKVEYSLLEEQPRKNMGMFYINAKTIEIGDSDCQ